MERYIGRAIPVRWQDKLLVRERKPPKRVFSLLRNDTVTPEENRLLSDLAAKIAQTPAPPRDPEAEEFIRKNIGSRPDALYLMTQTVLIQNMALQQAQQQIRDLQQRAPQPGYPAASSGSFLGGGYQTQPQQPQYAPPPPAASPSFMQGSGGGFLRGAAQTAAGVAAGALAFEGIRSLFEHPGYGGGGFGGGLGQAGFMGGAPVEETVVNNYYDSPEQADNQADNSDDTQTQDADYDDSNSSDFDDSSNSDDIA
jgi:uncharacterized protein